MALLALLVAACSTGAVSVVPPHPVGTVLEKCDHLGNAVPDRLGGLHARKTTPASPLTFAWGSPAVTLRCGVGRPGGFSPLSSTTLGVDGVRWYQQVGESVVVWTAIRPGPKPAGHVYVELRVPTHYPAGDQFLTALSAPLKVALP